MEPELLTVGLMARRSGLTIKALRYYDRTGLLRTAASSTPGSPGCAVPCTGSTTSSRKDSRRP
jgi:MerR family regulatory protein